jgi:hypothetical protein
MKGGEEDEGKEKRSGWDGMRERGRKRTVETDTKHHWLRIEHGHWSSQRLLSEDLEGKVVLFVCLRGSR